METKLPAVIAAVALLCPMLCRSMTISPSSSPTITATTQSGPRCCDTTGSYTADINNGEGGEYTAVSDDSGLKLADPRPSQGTVRISRPANI